MVKKYIFIASFVLVFICSLYLRTIQLDRIPGNLNPDEADTLRRYIAVVYAPQARPLLFDFNWNGAPIINTYFVGISWQLFHENIAGTRLPSALLTSLAIALTFSLIVLITKNNLYALLISLALASNTWLLSFSRSAWENAWNMVPLAIMALGYELSIRGKKYAILLMTVGAVLGFYGYHPGKMFVIPLVIGYIMVYTKQKSQSRRFILLIALNIFLYFVLVLPQLITSYHNQSMSLGRIETVSILQEPHPLEYFKGSIVNNIRGFLLFAPDITYVGLNARYVPQGISLVSTIFLPLFLIGLVGTFFRKNRHHIWYGLTFLLVLFPVQLLSRGTPDAARGVHTVGMYYLLIALGGWYIWSVVKKVRFFQSILGKLVISTIFTCILGYAIITDISLYFSWITSTQALNARQPAISSSQYPLWKDELKASIRQGNKGFSVEEWKSRELFRNNKVIIAP